jgi:2'-5' RNA ligase
MADYAVVAFLRGPREGATIRIRRRRHVTIKRRFKLNHIKPAALEALLKKATSNFPAFAVKLGKVYSFRKEGKFTQYLKVRPNRDLLKVHRGMVRALGKSIVTREPQFEGRNFVPHMTLRYQAAKPIKRWSGLPKSMCLRSLYLLEEVDYKKYLWKVRRSYDLRPA